MLKKSNSNVNVDKIKGLIVEKKTNSNEISRALGITTTSLLRRLRKERDFTADEIYILSTVLNEPINIFFN